MASFHAKIPIIEGNSPIMNIKTCIALALGAIALPLFASYSNAEIEVADSSIEFPEDRVSFYCGAIPNAETGETVPATLAYVPQRKAHIPIVAWTTQLAAWSPEKRCESVSDTFQTFHKDGRLNYLSKGESAGYPIICAKLDTEEECSGGNQLFQVKAGSNPEDVIAALQGTLSGEVGGVVIVQSSSSGQTNISMAKLLENAPAIDEDLIVK